MNAILSEADFTRVIAGLPGAGGAVTRPGPVALASPSGRGLEGEGVFLDLAGGGSGYLKLFHPEVLPFFDLATGFEVARRAGAAGIAPAVLWSDTAAGAILFAAAPSGWREAKLSDYLSPALRQAKLTALRRLHELPATGQRFDAFARTDALIAEARARQIALPEDLAWCMELLEAARPVLEAAPLALCRNEGTVSNLLIGPGAGVMLIDFDRAGLNDPMYDLGAVLAEMCVEERDMEQAFLYYRGKSDPAGFARARIWSALDDLMHALYCRVLGHISGRKALEWLKFGEWRLMRARLMLSHPGFEEKIRIAKGEA
ncbi:phosphotransferase family protein [Pseudogemmobacter faecipullorum]|uniref:Phosphotransferase n=1 Tax=Pseudogemmobacter faecipullorum TaxID=2755041 RepID=A0ABS8CM35_9RHOB|nr:phosphotransferase [Pseudogemmobacter faecipullorum]MCB5410452.1 phosphotransferase [Pseudogemmobacter faecipullorum]